LVDFDNSQEIPTKIYPRRERGVFWHISNLSIEPTKIKAFVGIE